MSSNSRTVCVAVLTLGLSGLGACASGAPTLHPSFGVAVNENMAAQIADPDARALNRPTPASDGARAGRAITLYREGLVARPTISSQSADAGAAPPAP